MSDRKPKKFPDTSTCLEPWPLLSSRILQTLPIYRLRQDDRRSPRTGRTHAFYVLDSGDWVNVVPVTPDGNVLLIRQFRHGTASFVWEIPGGMVDDEDEAPEAAARRELIEETGYEPERMRRLGVVHPNPAIQNNRCHTFLACNVRYRGKQRLDGSEDIEVMETPWAEVLGMVERGEITHALVLNALFWYQRFLAEREK